MHDDNVDSETSVVTLVLQRTAGCIVIGSSKWIFGKKSRLHIVYTELMRTGFVQDFMGGSKISLQTVEAVGLFLQKIKKRSV